MHRKTAAFLAHPTDERTESRQLAVQAEPAQYPQGETEARYERP